MIKISTTNRAHTVTLISQIAKSIAGQANPEDKILIECTQWTDEADFPIDVEMDYTDALHRRIKVSYPTVSRYFESVLMSKEWQDGAINYDEIASFIFSANFGQFCALDALGYLFDKYALSELNVHIEKSEVEQVSILTELTDRYSEEDPRLADEYRANVLISILPEEYDVMMEYVRNFLSSDNRYVRGNNIHIS